MVPECLLPGLPVDVIASVLAGVGFDNLDAATSVSADGSTTETLSESAHSIRPACGSRVRELSYVVCVCSWMPGTCLTLF
jgi:hypothetical protein